jgi:hypothetical protein
MTAVSRRVLAFEPRTDLSRFVDLRWPRDRVLKLTPDEGEAPVNRGFHLFDRVEHSFVRSIEDNSDL